MSASLNLLFRHRASLVRHATYLFAIRFLKAKITIITTKQRPATRRDANYKLSVIKNTTTQPAFVSTNSATLSRRASIVSCCCLHTNSNATTQSCLLSCFTKLQELHVPDDQF